MEHTLEVKGTVHHVTDKPSAVRIKLERGMKGTYAWELTAEGEDAVKVLDRLADADMRLRQQYGEAESCRP